MLIYFVRSTSFDFKKEYYAPIQKSNLSQLHTLVFPHLKSGKPFPTRELFESGKCDLVVAEISYPSTGGGIEIGWANVFGIPIILVAREDADFSSSLESLGISVLRYRDSANLVKRLENELEKMDT
jgi:hypothetical protein